MLAIIVLIGEIQDFGVGSDVGLIVLVAENTGVQVL
jgi:hypothetical protein